LHLSEKTRVVVARDQVACDVAEEVVVLNLASGVYYGLNPVGARVWSLIQQPRTFAELRDQLLQEYEVESASLEADLRALLTELADQRLIEITA